jgi:hypothetical protein
MATLVLTDVTTFIAGHDFTTDSNEASVSIEVDDQENTTFGGNGFRSRVGGLRSVETEISGYWQAGADQVDANMFANLGSRDEPVTVSPTGALGDIAYFFLGGRFSYEIFGGIGDVAPFTVSVMSTDSRTGLVRGKLAAARADVAAVGPVGVAVTGLSGTGAVEAGQYLYAAVHVFGAGTSLALDVESAPDGTFAAPTTRASAGPLTAAGGTWVTRVAGPISDEHYRFRVTAVTGPFNVAGAIGIA